MPVGNGFQGLQQGLKRTPTAELVDDQVVLYQGAVGHLPDWLRLSQPMLGQKSAGQGAVAQQVHAVLQRQVGQAGLADLAIDQGISGTGSKREVTVLFVDLRGYTRFSESHPPEDVVAMLNRFFRVVVAEVSRAGGWVNKFEGDAALCLFGAPQDQPDHADRALRAAVSLPAALEAADDLLGAGIGVARGEVIAGVGGTPERFEYTVIGDVVNLASRLCDEAKAVPSGVLASSSTILSASQREAWVPSGRLTIRGRQEKAAVYTLRPAQKRRARRYSTPWSSKPESSAP